MSLKNYKIVALHPNAINFAVRGLIIGKSNMRTFEKIAQQREPSLCGVVKFLIRDSIENYINLTVWGTKDFVEVYNSQYDIGHVVNVVRSKISFVRQDDIFNPITSTPLQLTINEGFGSIEFYDGSDGSEFVRLLSIPLKPLDLALNLADIVSTRPTSDTGDLVDLVVVVARIHPIRQTTTDKSVRDVIVIDHTLPGMHLTLWNEAWINRSNSWNEMATTLHLINVGYKYVDFYKSIALSTLSRTIIVADPIGDRCTSLKDYARHSTLILSDFDTTEPDLSTITTVMTIQQIISRLNDSSSDAVFYSLTYAMITQLDIDGCTLFYSRRCVHCNCQIKLNSVSCDKENCSIFFAESPLDEHFINYFNIPVHLTDHTGTLQCRLVGDTAERVLGTKLDDFLRLNDTDRCSVKWTLLMERCKIKLSIKRKTALRWKTQITIADCQVADPVEVLEKIKAY